MDDLPVTDKARLRPVYRRYLEMKHSMPLLPPTEEEQSDAIKVMQECYPPIWEIDEILLCTAEAIFHEASNSQGGNDEVHRFDRGNGVSARNVGADSIGPACEGVQSITSEGAIDPGIASALDVVARARLERG